jgi:hypothetical protein
LLLLFSADFSAAAVDADVDFADVCVGVRVRACACEHHRVSM